jgi:hypothetical protein
LEEAVLSSIILSMSFYQSVCWFYVLKTQFLFHVYTIFPSYLSLSLVNYPIQSLALVNYPIESLAKKEKEDLLTFLDMLSVKQILSFLWPNDES